MKYDTHLAEVAEFFDEMGISNDDHIQFDYDAETQTLHIHVLSQEELDSLAGYKETECDRCIHANTCRDAHKTSEPCDAFIDKEEAW